MNDPNSTSKLIKFPSPYNLITAVQVYFYDMFQERAMAF